MKGSMLFAAFGLMAVTGCPSARRGGPAAPDVEVDTKQEIRGQRVFDENCHRCHPGGAAGLGPAINNKPIPAEALRNQIRHGHGAMPEFDVDHLSENDLDAVIEYLFTLRTGK